MSICVLITFAGNTNSLRTKMAADVASMNEVVFKTGEIEGESEATVISVETNAREGKGGICKRVPKRILHFSDGILEEYSEDEDEKDGTDKKKDEETRKNLSQALIDPKTMTWGPFFWYKMMRAGNTTLAACDFVGEHLANFFGITSPKYQFEIDDYFRQKAEDEKEKDRREMELKNWTNVATDQEAVAQQPNSTDWQRVDV